ncbi:hypothetical protein EMCRGX_G013111 [Ephydatia muelleri]
MDIRSGGYEGHGVYHNTRGERQVAELLKRAILTSPNKGVEQLATGGAVCPPGLHIMLGIFSKLFHMLQAVCSQLDLKLANVQLIPTNFSKYSQALQRLPLLQADLENAQHAQEVLQQVATYVALVNMEKNPPSCGHAFADSFLGRTFFIVVDVHSKWLEITPVVSTSSQQVVQVLRRLYSTHGLPEVAV